MSLEDLYGRVYRRGRVTRVFDRPSPYPGVRVAGAVTETGETITRSYLTTYGCCPAGEDDVALVVLAIESELDCPPHGDAPPG